MAELKRGAYRVMTKRQCDDLDSASKRDKLERLTRDNREVMISLSRKAFDRLSSLGKNLSDVADLLFYADDNEIRSLRKRQWNACVAAAKIAAEVEASLKAEEANQGDDHV